MCLLYLSVMIYEMEKNKSLFTEQPFTKVECVDKGKNPENKVNNNNNKNIASVYIGV